MTAFRRRGRRTTDRIPPAAEGDELEWMDVFDELDEDMTEQVLRGRAEEIDPELRDVARVVAALRAGAATEPVPEMSSALRARLRVGPDPVVVAHRRARRALVLAAACAAVVVALGIGAAQNRLPAGVQDAVSSTAEVVGLDVPSSDDRHAEEEDGAEDTRRGQGGGGPVGDVPSGGRDDGAAVGPLGEAGQPPPSTPGGAIPADPAGSGPAVPASPPDKVDEPAADPVGPPADVPSERVTGAPGADADANRDDAAKDKRAK